MLKSKWLVASLLAALVLSIGSTNAQYVGPGAEKTAANVAEILKDPVDDMIVVLRGKLVNKLSGDRYTFSDGTGDIVVEIDHKHFPAQQVTETTVVEIHAEVDKDFFAKPELEAEKVTVVAQ